MKKSILSIFAAVLAMLMLASVLTACGNPSGDTDGSTQAIADSTPEAGENASTDAQDTGVVSNLPKDLKYNEEINVLVWDDVEHEEFESEGTNGELVNDSIWKRNDTIENRFGLTINWYREKGNSDNKSQWHSKVGNAISAGDHSYDILACYSLSIAMDAAAGYCANLKNEDFKYLELDKPWWSKLLTEQATMYGKLFFASGDISRNALEMMYVCFVNKYVLNEYKLENPQNYVETNEWTFDKFIEMCQGVYQGSGTKDEATDTFGYMSQGIHFDPWLYASGSKICEVDQDGKLIESPTFFSETVINTIEKFQGLLQGEFGMVGSSAGKHQTAFKENRLLFCTERARTSHKTFAQNPECTFYVVPTPKYSVDQEEYYTCMGNPFTLYTAIVDVQDKEKASLFLEAMAYYGYEFVTPAVFEISLKTRYVDDPVSGQMYDIIRESLTYDLGRIFSADLIGQGDFKTAIAGTVNNWASKQKGTSLTLKKKLDTLNNKIASYED